MRWRFYDLLAYSCPGADTAGVLIRLHYATIPWITRHTRASFGSDYQSGERLIHSPTVAWHHRWGSAGSRAQYGVCSAHSAERSDA